MFLPGKHKSIHYLHSFPLKLTCGVSMGLSSQFSSPDTHNFRYVRFFWIKERLNFCSNQTIWFIWREVYTCTVQNWTLPTTGCSHSISANLRKLTFLVTARMSELRVYKANNFTAKSEPVRLATWIFNERLYFFLWRLILVNGIRMHKNITLIELVRNIQFIEKIKNYLRLQLLWKTIPNTHIFLLWPAAKNKH